MEGLGLAHTATKAALLDFARFGAMDLAHDGMRASTITKRAMEHQTWTKMADELQPDLVRPQTGEFPMAVRCRASTGIVGAYRAA